ncbi:MAG TPA: polymer-forming cytoskeletal protein [Candidatus Acidoferrum sp.]
MWLKADESKQSPSPGTLLADDSANTFSSLSQGIKIKGEISGQGDLLMDGVFEGKIHLADGVFTVGPNARANAEIEAREIIVRGEVVGTLKARERVQIASTGKVTGDLDTRGVVIEDGAVLHAKVATPQLAASQAPEREAVLREKDQAVQLSSEEILARGKTAAAGAADQPNPEEP